MVTGEATPSQGRATPNRAFETDAPTSGAPFNADVGRHGRTIIGSEYEAFLNHDSARRRYVVGGPCTDGASRSMSHGDVDRHPERSVGFQRSGWRWYACALRRRQQRLRSHRAAVRRRTWHKHATVTDRCDSGTAKCDLLYAHARR